MCTISRQNWVDYYSQCQSSSSPCPSLLSSQESSNYTTPANSPTDTSSEELFGVADSLLRFDATNQNSIQYVPVPLPPPGSVHAEGLLNSLFSLFEQDDLAVYSEDLDIAAFTAINESQPVINEQPFSYHQHIQDFCSQNAYPIFYTEQPPHPFYHTLETQWTCPSYTHPPPPTPVFQDDVDVIFQNFNEGASMHFDPTLLPPSHPTTHIMIDSTSPPDSPTPPPHHSNSPPTELASQAFQSIPQTLDSLQASDVSPFDVITAVMDPDQEDYASYRRDIYSKDSEKLTSMLDTLVKDVRGRKFMLQWISGNEVLMEEARNIEKREAKAGTKKRRAPKRRGAD